MAEIASKKATTAKAKAQAQEVEPKVCFPDHADWGNACKLMYAAIASVKDSAGATKKEIDEYAAANWSNVYNDVEEVAIIKSFGSRLLC
jgi:hypothetical protein